ncbi:MAG: lipase family alpha/beta hydrolase [Kiloniellaceae bacterium]
MTLTIVGIHGLANKPPRETLAKWWEQSIREGLEKNCGKDNPDLECRMVYWADLLYKNLLHDDKAFVFDDLYNAQPYREAADGALREHKDGFVDEARRIMQSLGGSVIDRVKSSFNVDFAANWILDKHLKDLALYYTPERRIRDRSGQLRPARQVLIDELERALRDVRGRQVMVVAHSMGSIIAYDALRDIGRSDDRFDIDYFVTIGSPLGLPHVKVNVYEERKSYAKKGETPVRTPTIVAKAWRNYADRLDPVAFDAHLSDDFDVNVRGIKVVDDLVSNDYVAPDGKPNRHKSYGYLRTPELSKLIAPLV